MFNELSGGAVGFTLSTKFIFRVKELIYGFLQNISSIVIFILFLKLDPKQDLDLDLGPDLVKQNAGITIQVQ